MKLIIADLDGTIVHLQHVTEKTLWTIKELQKKGFHFTVATGRHVNATKEIVQKLDLQLPVICSNGAYIYDFKNNQIIDEVLLDEQTAARIINLLNEQHYNYLLYTRTHIIGTEQSKALLTSKIGQVPIQVEQREQLKQNLQLGLVKILVIEKDSERMNLLKSNLQSDQNIYAIQSQTDFLDIGNKKANKGLALEKLTHHLNITLKDCLAIGDQENDIEMIVKAKVGVAMGNGVQALKEVADFITKSYAEEGFSYAIESLIFKHNE